ncbi:hypothetical protein [Streptomyces justiciae]|uniref:hypothetical protein n=1 Tax=Streptomyces justiciae TaxID=2780140 RepID=UPI002118B1F7|nr:hypothetical protein [Streptomyces justiciae]MCW8383977.1 hypothetical protein [Streptomyces justiciae]
MNEHLDSTPGKAPAVYRYASTADAYAACQSNSIQDGDVLLVEPEGIVGIVIQAWPITITTGAFGEFHRLGCPARTYDDGRYAASVDVAEDLAAGLGLPVEERHRAAFDAELTTGPLITAALTAEGIVFETADSYLRVPTSGGEILISAVHCNHPSLDGRSHYDIPRAHTLGYIANWYDTITPDGGAAEVYDARETRLQPGDDAAACAFAVRAFLTPDGGRRLRLMRAALDTSRPGAATRAKAELRRLVGDGIAAARRRRWLDKAPF